MYKKNYASYTDANLFPKQEDRIMNKSLVAFFSATGTTKKTAELIASAANADLYEILPKIPYSASDLDWMDNHSRSSMEMKDKTYCSPHPAAADLEIPKKSFSFPHRTPF